MHILYHAVLQYETFLNVSQTQLQQIPNEYATALKEFSEQINNQLKGKQLPKEQIKSVNNSLEELARDQATSS
jgi:hypothetical protein